MYQVKTQWKLELLLRFSTGGGVTQPSQVRYVKYFERLLFGEPLKAKGYFLNTIICAGISDVDSLYPYINIFEVKKTKDVQDDLMVSNINPI